jgi:histidyl-tRNA synthetase
MLQHIPGTFDVLPDATDGIAASHAWAHVEAVIRAVMGRFGFAEIRTPVLEPTALIARGVGGTTDIVQKEMFAFTRGDTDYVLRPEVTAPVMRAYLEHRLDLQGGSQRLFYLGPCFRAERPQKGRYRQFHQFGAEVIGSAAPEADAECIALMTAVYAAFGVTNTRLRLNSLGSPEARDRFRAALREHLAPHADALSETSRQRLAANPLRILDTKDAREQRLLEGAPVLSDFLDDDDRAHYARVRALLDAAGIGYVQDDRLVRGLDYYGRTTWELESPDIGAKSALAGGGRYDGLAEVLGHPQAVPAVGFAAGMERLFLALDAAGYDAGGAEKPAAFVVALQGGTEAAFVLSQRLRGAGVRTGLSVAPGSFKKLMRDAERSGAPFAVLIGESEAASGVAQVKDLRTGTQQAVAFDALAGVLAGAS